MLTRKLKEELKACLRCNNKFYPEGKFNRICPTCHKNESTPGIRYVSHFEMFAPEIPNNTHPYYDQ